MSEELKLNTKDEPLREVLGNSRRYIVPRFQRDYSWRDEHLEDLWEDIVQLFNNRTQKFHYMGYLVLKNTEEYSKYEVIDGQQRLATISLMVLAAIKRLKELSEQDSRNSEHAEELEKNFIGTKGITSLRIDKKLTLNRNNQEYYRRATEHEEIPLRSVKPTVRLMRQAMDFFSEKFAGYSSGVEIAELIEHTANHMLFTNIYIGSEVSAYLVFETLNARGVKLSSADLLKNYLFATVAAPGEADDEVFNDLDEDWAYIGEQIEREQYTKYILSEWNSRHRRVRESKLFQAIREEITTREAAEQYISMLRHDCQLYGALLNAENDFWREHPDSEAIKKEIQFLNLFNVRQPISMLMASYRSFKKEFPQILHWVSVISLRYTVIGGQKSAPLEEVYNQISIKINNNGSVQDVKEMLLRIYPNDRKFISDFTDKTMPTRQLNKRAKYILARVAEQLQGDNSLHINESPLTVEHILPQKPIDKWTEYFGIGWQQCADRLGNMALVTKAENTKLGQEPFDKKQNILRKNAYNLNRDIGIYPDWDPQSVAARQEQLAEAAAQVWRIA